MLIVLLDDNNKLTDFYQVKTIMIYKKKNSEFKVIDEISDLVANTSNIKIFRQFLEQLVPKFGGSNIIIGSQITGIAFHYFAKLGYEICEADELSEQVLEQIYYDFIENPKVLDAEDKRQREEKENTPVTPVALDDKGNYYLDFIRVQKYRPEISSKKALLPFLSTQTFQTLTIHCSHVMPWLEHYFIQQNHMEYRSEREHGRYTIVITNS